MNYLHDACIAIVISFNSHHISNEGGVTTPLVELCVLKLKNKTKTTYQIKMPDSSTFPFQKGKVLPVHARCLQQLHLSVMAGFRSAGYSR